MSPVAAKTQRFRPFLWQTVATTRFLLLAAIIFLGGSYVSVSAQGETETPTPEYTATPDDTQTPTVTDLQRVLCSLRHWR